MQARVGHVRESGSQTQSTQQVVAPATCYYHGILSQRLHLSLDLSLDLSLRAGKKVFPRAREDVSLGATTKLAKTNVRLTLSLNFGMRVKTGAGTKARI